MRRRRLVLAAGLAAVALLTCGRGNAAAQGVRPAPPGPYVIDVRGATMGLPQAFGFYPALPDETLVPARGFGIDVGAHIYVARLGPSRVGVGANLIQVRGSTPGISASARLIAPQVSFNFGTSEGWSYLSGGVGTAEIEGTYGGSVLDAETTRDSGITMATNFGGGARWFFTPRLAVGFDLRLHRVSAREATEARPGTPGTMVVAAAVGLSVK
jgi:hypothetical protein